MEIALFYFVAGLISFLYLSYVWLEDYTQRMKGRTVGGIARQATQVAVLNQKSFIALKFLVLADILISIYIMVQVSWYIGLLSMLLMGFLIIPLYNVQIFCMRLMVVVKTLSFR